MSSSKRRARSTPKTASASAPARRSTKKPAVSTGLLLIIIRNQHPGRCGGSAPGKSRSGGVKFLNVLDVVIILAYFVGMIALGLIANKKQTGVDDYYLGGRARWAR